MAKLPSAADLQRRPAPAATPDIRVGRIDYSPMEKAAADAGSALAGSRNRPGIAQAFQAFADAGQKDEQHELDRKLLDFKLDTEMEYERNKREMPPGADGYSESWTENYRNRAKDFVGENYANIPERLRPHVDQVLHSHDVVLRERATRDEYAERDRKTLDDLELTLGKTRSAVEANPDRLEEIAGEGDKLIAGSSLTPAMKHAYAKKYRASVEEAAANSVADRVTDAASYAKAKEILAPHKAERVTAKAVRDDLRSAVKKFEGYTAKAEWDYKQHSIGYGTRAKHAGEVIDKDEAERRLDDELSKAAKLVDDFAPNLPKGTRDALTSLTFNAGSGWMSQGLGQAVKSGDTAAIRERFLQYNKAGGEANQGLINRRRAEAAWIGQGEPDNATVPVGTTDQPDTYDGPFQNLSLAKRRAIWARVEGNMDKMKKGVEQAIKDQNSVAADGYLPPEPVLNAIQSKVQALNDPILAAQFDAMLRNAQYTARLQKAPPLAIEEEARKLREMASVNGATKEMDDQIKHIEKVGANVRKAVNDDPMGWAAKSQINVPLSVPQGASFEQAEAITQRAPVQLEQLNFAASDIGAKLAYRMNQAKAVGNYYGQPPQVLTTNEREFLKDTLRQGGAPMLSVLGQIGKAAAEAGIEPASIMKEFSKDAPEVAVIGQMVASNADPEILKTAATALSWRAKQGEKFESTIDKAQAKPDLAEYAGVLSTTPTQVDAVKQTANLIYEYEARRQGLQQFDNNVYQGVVRRIMGETTGPDGTAYGGVGNQGRGWSDGKYASGGFGAFFGSTPKVLVPGEIRNDSFDDMVGAIRPKDLPQMPVDGTGKPLTMSQVRSASWVSLGPGRYALELKRDSDGTRVVAHDAAGQTYVLDVRPILPAIQKRKPQIFKSYDGSQRAVAEPE